MCHILSMQKYNRVTLHLSVLTQNDKTLVSDISIYCSLWTEMLSVCYIWRSKLVIKGVTQPQSFTDLAQLSQAE